MAIGNPDFRFTLSGADPAGAFAILTVNPLPDFFTCGPCNWLLPAPGLLFFQALSGGEASFEATIPCSAPFVGTPLYAQWLSDSPGSAACFLLPDFQLSNTLELFLGN